MVRPLKRQVSSDYANKQEMLKPFFCGEPEKAGRLGGAWATSGYSISSNIFVPSASLSTSVGNGGDSYWNANTFGASQEACIKVSPGASSGEEQNLL